jgi:hypothetical protein
MAQHIGIALRDEIDLHPSRGENILLNVARSLPEFDDERYPLLRLVDPYGDTIFSSYQMVGLLAELQARLAETGDSSIAEAIVAANRCKNRPRTWLVFIGD